MKLDNVIPNLVIIGDSAYDTNKFYYDDGNTMIKTNFGGSSIYASIPASVFFRVGLVSNAGEDFELDKLQEFNIDLKGFHIQKGEKTSRFYNILRTKDRQARETTAEYNENLTAKFEDIPEVFLNAKYFYVSTMLPSKQKQLIEKLRISNPNAVIGVDTFEGYVDLKETIDVFNLADIAFIDKEFSKLLHCKADVKIIKLGKTGCILLDNNGAKKFSANVIEEVVDKTGAGDCLNGVFMNLIANGYSNELALKKAVETATLSINDFGILNIKNKMQEQKSIMETTR